MRSAHREHLSIAASSLKLSVIAFIAHFTASFLLRELIHTREDFEVFKTNFSLLPDATMLPRFGQICVNVIRQIFIYVF